MLLQLSGIYNLIILRTRYFLLLHDVQAGCGAYPASSSVGTRFFRGVKWLGRDVDHSPPSSAEIKNVWSSARISLYVFMLWAGRALLYFFG